MHTLLDWLWGGGIGGLYILAAQEVTRATAAECMPLLRLAQQDDVQNIGLENIVAGCQFFQLERGGVALAYALKVEGCELWVQAAGGRGDIDLSDLMHDCIYQQAQKMGLASVGFQTRRLGLVKKAQQHGYKIDGYILRKIIDV